MTASLLRKIQHKAYWKMESRLSLVGIFGALGWRFRSDGENPGIPYSNPMIEKALAKGFQSWLRWNWLIWFREAPIIGITGSNGKTTTTTMIGEVLTAAGQRGLLSGNIGYPASQVAQTATAKDTLVMELSSSNWWVSKNSILSWLLPTSCQLISTSWFFWRVCGS